MIITEPKWKSYIAQTTGEPLFNPEQCQRIIEAGRSQPRIDAQVGTAHGSGTIDTQVRTSHISWIPFSILPKMYKKIETTMLKTNGNHFGFDGMRITELAQYTEYPEGGFYNWHIDSDVHCVKEPPVRKISMTCLLSPDSEFEGGDLEIMAEGQVPKISQGQAVFFASFLRHRVIPVTRGTRKSLVMWFGGPPLR
tara:strand:- start:911 stop:1495 length:585 start_codon:yes stop_codon:yes gene_type:complete